MILCPYLIEKDHWGKKVIAFLETIDESEWADIEDPVEWVKAQRRDSERQFDWGDDKSPQSILPYQL